ncbi:hypothetical protein FA95DRAFT_1554177 [Auriscalpium vulgare]|uniref:Uncharacterized protein n=1 Tax=Auriscalpium vulgare TaxID=40419 RepID=A0ACB8S6E6_9AGAM|nr:hypothetical protein FA95DRAFT_1554177 [Auriscalpium vulgare]
MQAAANIRQLLGHPPSSQLILQFLSSLSTTVSTSSSPTPEVKAYPDAVYFNFYALGISLLFLPVHGYKPRTGTPRADLEEDHLVLDGIDIYNSPERPPPEAEGKSARGAATSIYSAYPIFPMALTLPPRTVDGKERPSAIAITQQTTGKEFLTWLGEPDRKGGGAGPSSGSIGIWIQYSKDGLMVEFGGDESRGPQAWDRGKDAVWKVISIIPPTE